MALKFLRPLYICDKCGLQDEEPEGWIETEDLQGMHKYPKYDEEKARASRKIYCVQCRALLLAASVPHQTTEAAALPAAAEPPSTPSRTGRE